MRNPRRPTEPEVNPHQNPNSLPLLLWWIYRLRGAYSMISVNHKKWHNHSGSRGCCDPHMFCIRAWSTSTLLICVRQCQMSYHSLVLQYNATFIYQTISSSFFFRHFCPFYLRPVLALSYCHCLYLCVCVSVSVCQTRFCPCDNSSPVQARTTKFGQKWKMQNTLIKIPIVLGVDGSWPSRSNLTKIENLTMPILSIRVNTQPPQ